MTFLISYRSSYCLCKKEIPSTGLSRHFIRTLLRQVGDMLSVPFQKRSWGLDGLMPLGGARLSASSLRWCTEALSRIGGLSGSTAFTFGCRSFVINVFAVRHSGSYLRLSMTF